MKNTIEIKTPIDFLYYLSPEYDCYRVGCDGCDSSRENYGSDYCRCGQIKNPRILNFSQVNFACNILNKMSLHHKNKMDLITRRA